MAAPAVEKVIFMYVRRLGKAAAQATWQSKLGLAAVGLCLGLFLAMEPAFADCQPNAPAPGGTVTCSGNDNDGFIAPANTPVTVNVQSGANVNAAGNGNAITFAPGTFGNVLTNLGNLNGSIGGSGDGSINLQLNGVLNGGITITDNGTNSVTNFPFRNVNAPANISGAVNTIDNSGSFNQGLILTGTIKNTVINRTGAFINQTLTITGNGTNTLDNFGTLNNGVIINGGITNTVTNRAGAFINQTFTITSNGANTVDNFGIINNGLTINGTGTNFVTNAANATINQDITALTGANNTLSNLGLINNNIRLGPGNDVVTNSGTINGLVDQGDGANQFFMLSGTINNQVLQGSGNDMATILAGTITQQVSTGAGNDQLLWTGGTIGALAMGAGADVAILRNLTSTNLKTITVDGGLENDRLFLDNTIADNVQRFINWESIELTNASQLTFNGTLRLGDAGTGTGALSIDPTSTVFAGQGNHAIVPFASGLLATVTNAGTIDLTNGGSVPSDSLSITGNYVGQAGRLLENTVLATDGAASDRLIINRGAASGTTSLIIKNAAGLGDLTVANGILVVDAVNGASTAPGAFTLGAPVVAGPYEYALFRGSVDASNPQAWFLRSRVDCSQPNAPIPPCQGPTPPEPPTPPNPNPPPTPPIPNFRQEVSLYAAIPALALLYGRTLLDTLHERVGEQEHLRTRSDPSASPYNNGTWGRVIAQHGNRDGDTIGIFGAGPRYEYDFGTFQIGQDLFRTEQPNGWRTHAGVYAAIGGAHSDVEHFNGLSAGHDTFMAYTTGGYWTTFGPSGWYLDSVLQATFYDIDGDSNRLPALRTEGWGLGASLEGGAPFKFGGGWQIEPQAQLIFQTININQGSDVGATVRFDDVDSLAGRVGVRLANTWTMPSMLGISQPSLVTGWFRPNLWHEFLGDPKTLFSSETGFIPFRADLGGSWVELNGGISAQINRTTSLYANASYQIGLDGDSTAWDAKVGLRVNW